MVFHDPRAGDVTRHPSQLYEALLEGIVLFAVLWWFTRRPRPAMAASGVFLIGYGLARSFVEFVRVPDAHLGYLAFEWVTMGHVLTLPMIAARSDSGRNGGDAAGATAGSDVDETNSQNATPPLKPGGRPLGSRRWTCPPEGAGGRETTGDVGWGTRIRTLDWRSQSPLSCR